MVSLHCALVAMTFSPPDRSNLHVHTGTNDCDQFPRNWTQVGGFTLLSRDHVNKHTSQKLKQQQTTISAAQISMNAAQTTETSFVDIWNIRGCQLHAGSTGSRWDSHHVHVREDVQEARQLVRQTDPFCKRLSKAATCDSVRRKGMRHVKYKRKLGYSGHIKSWEFFHITPNGLD